MPTVSWLSFRTEFEKYDPLRGSEDVWWASACLDIGVEWVSGQRACLSGTGRVGHWHGQMGWGSSGRQHPPRTEASRAGFGQEFRCLDAYVSFLQRFSVGNVESAAVQPRVGIAGILLGLGVWYQRSEQKPGEGAWGPFCRALPWSLRSNRITDYRPEPLSLMLAFLFPIFHLISDWILDSACWKGTLEFSWCTALTVVVKTWMHWEMERCTQSKSW